MADFEEAGEEDVLRKVRADLEAAGQVVLRYVDEAGLPTQRYPDNPNGSLGAVAGLCDPTGRIAGLMPHPERAVDDLLGSADGAALLRSLLASAGAGARTA